MKKIWKGILLTFVLTLTLSLSAPVSSFVPSNVSVVEAAAKIKLNKTKATLAKGKTLQLKISGTKKKVTWISSNKKVATVNNKGKVTAKKAGTVTITAKVGSKKYTCKVTVQSPKISASNVTLNVNKNVTLKMTGTIGKVKWSSSNKKIATVNSKGKVTAKKVGTAIITAKVDGKTYKCKVSVKAVKIEISDTLLNLAVGDTYTLKVTGSSKKIVWSSDKTSVASVNSKGKVTANGCGMAIITAKINGKSYECSVSVDHQRVTASSKTPTCTSTGLTEGVYCSICGKVFVSQNVLPAMGHNVVIDQAVEATATTTGLTEGSHCINCGAIIIPQNVIPKLSPADASRVEYYLSNSYKTWAEDSFDYNEYIIEIVAIEKENMTQGKFKTTVTILVYMEDQQGDAPDYIKGEWLFVKDGKQTAGGGTFHISDMSVGDIRQYTFTNYNMEIGDYKLTFSSTW